MREVNIRRVVPTPEDRSYAEWFTWAKRGGAPVNACHSAAQAAFHALSTGKDVAVAAQMAAAAMVNPPLPVDSGRQTYCAWFALANIDLITKVGVLPGGTHVAFLSNGQKVQVSRLQSRTLRTRFLKL